MLAAVAAYSNSLDNPFVYDDHLTVENNPSLEDPSNLRAVLLHFPFRPLVNLSYAVDRAVWGPDPWGFHLTNLLLHLLDVALVWTLARRVFRDADAAAPAAESGAAERAAVAAFVVAATFAVHPLLSSAVGYVSGRSELLAAAFSLSALLLVRGWIDRGGVLRVAAALLLFAGGLAAKETAAAVPFLALAWDRLLRLGADDERRRRLLRFHLPLVGLVVAGGVLRVATFFRLEDSELPRSVGTNLATQLTILWRYVALLIVPRGFSVVHPAEPVASLADPAFVASALALAAGAVAAWRWRRRAPVAVLGAIWLLVVLAPSSSLVPLNELMAEHRVYLAAVGFFLALGALAGRLWARLAAAPARRMLAIGCCVVLVALTALTIGRGRVWADEVSLWAEAAERAPRAWASHFFLAEAMRRRDGCAAALPSYRTAIALRPEHESAHLRIGVCLADAGNAAEARSEFETALALDPSSSQALDYLGRIAGNAGDYDLARRYFERAVAANPNDVTALLDLAKLHESVLRQPEEALRLCRQALARGEVRGPSEECVHRNQAAIAARGAPSSAPQ
jgi:tetratricopeptide (TPR) repeat protein